MKAFFIKFLASKVSGVIAIISLVVMLGGGAFITKQVYDYKELQRKAAFCEGRLSMVDFTKALSDRAVDQVRKGTKDTIRELEEEKDIAKSLTPEDTGEAIVIPPEGCASQRAPDAILRYHGLRE